MCVTYIVSRSAFVGKYVYCRNVHSMSNKKSTLRSLQMFVDVILSIPAHAPTRSHTHHVCFKVQSTQSVGTAVVTVDAATRIPRSKFCQNGEQ